MFSKPLHIEEKNIENRFIKPPKISKQKHPTVSLFFNEYFKNNTVLKKYKVDQLKNIAKSNKLHITGSKQVLIDRIELHFNKCVTCEKIQKIFKGYIVRKSFALRGDGFKNRKLCVNENDFYSMEPLHEIPFEYFVSFNSNDNKFVYGCNIISLIHLIQNKSAIKNPYNRETIKIEVIQNIVKLYNVIKILFKMHEDAPNVDTTILLNVHNNINNNRIVAESMRQPTQSVYFNDTVMNERLLKLNTMRSKTIPVRIQELFMEIDQLGNYTNYQWFENLGRTEYIRLYRSLFHIWTYRGHLSREMKCKICILEDPFHEINRGRFHLHDVSIDAIREICLKIFENMVYCGIDDEYRKIGTLHALSALTMVSEHARNAMPWLYESLYP